MFNFFKAPSLAQVAAQMLFEAEMQLLEAEVARERADANVSMLKLRVARLTAMKVHHLIG